MSLFSRLFPRKQAQPQQTVTPAMTPVPQAPRPKVVNYRLNSSGAFQNVLASMGRKNPNYALTKRELVNQWPGGTTVYEYVFYPGRVELIPEPENQHNPKAIKVLVGGVHVGYIKDGSCVHIHHLLQENYIKRIVPRITGGKYKELYTCDAYTIRSRNVAEYELKRGTKPFTVCLEILEQPTDVW